MAGAQKPYKRVAREVWQIVSGVGMCVLMVLVWPIVIWRRRRRRRER